MKIGHSNCLWLTKQMEMEVAVKEIAEAGYEGIEPLSVSLTAFQKEDPGKLKDLLQEAGLELAAVIVIPMGMDDYKSLIDFLQKVDAETFSLVTHVIDNDLSREENMRKMVSITEELAHYAGDRGMKISFHTHSGPFIVRTQEEIDELFERVKSDNVRLCLDIAQLAGACIDVPQMVRDYADIIDDVHFKDITRPGPIIDLDGARDFTDMGDGIIDFEPIGKALKEVGYDGWLTGDNDVSASPIESARKVYNRIKELIY